MAIAHLSASGLRVCKRDLHHLWLLANKSRLGEAAAQAVVAFLAVAFPSASRLVASLANESATIAIGTDGELAVFGRAEFELPRGAFASVQAGFNHLCALRRSGELVCAGRLTMPEELGRVVAVASGCYHVCAVKATGELVCFGDNRCGQCHVPSDVGPVVAVAAGREHTCVLTAAGDVVCFGENEDGQCEVPPGLGSTVLLAAGHAHSCAVSADGVVACWGDNRYGQCDVPRGFGPKRNVVKWIHACAMDANGELLRERGHDVGPGLGPVLDVVAGARHTCALKANGELLCFGAHGNGQCDVPPGLGRVVAVAVGPYHTCAVTAAGELVCFGSNMRGQCEVTRDFRVQLLTPAAEPITPLRQVPHAEASAAVLQLMDRAEPAANVNEEGTAIGAVLAVFSSFSHPTLLLFACAV